MKEEQVYNLSRKALEPVIGVIAEGLFGVELEQTSDAEDRVYKIDIKNNDMSFNIQVKTKKSKSNHYYFKSNDELDRNSYIAYFDASFNDEIIDNLGLLYNKEAIKKYLLDNPIIYFVDTDYLKLLMENGEIEYNKAYNEYWITNKENIEHYYDTEYYKSTGETYVHECKISNKDLSILDMIYQHMKM